MRKPAPRPRARAARPTPPRGPNSRWIILIDETPLRDEMLREHDRLESQAAKLREHLERFETADVPAYTRWEARALGPLLTAIREGEAEISRKRTILEAVEDECFFSGCSELAAYRRVMGALEDGPDADEDENPFARESKGGMDPEEGGDASGFATGEHMFGESDLPPGFDADEFDLMSPARQREFREQYMFMAELYESATGKPAPDLDELLRLSRQKKRQGAAQSQKSERASAAPPPPPPPPERPAPDASAARVASRIKEIYRTLVRKLHPDLNPTQSAREAELWHQVQDAYGRRDLEALEAAAARVELSQPGSAARLPVYLLRRVVGDLRRALNSLKSRLATARKHPAWDFTASTRDLAKYEAKQRQKLEQHQRSVQNYLAALTSQLDALAARAAKPKRARKSKPPRRSSQYAQEDFSPFG